MKYLVSILGMVGSYYLIKYRERAGDMIGEPAWAAKIGGIYNLLILLGIFIFFWCIATITNTTDVLFAPLFWLIPGATKAPAPTPWIQ